MLRSVLSLCFRVFKNLFLLALPSIVVYFTVSIPIYTLTRGEAVIRPAVKYRVHFMFPNTNWSNLRPCGEYFDELKEFSIAKTCANSKVWPDSNLPQDLVIPRCYVVGVGSPDIFLAKDRSFNFVPIPDPAGMAAVVGVYQPGTHTVFLVENIDIADIYRHELQHYFLHIHDPKSGGAGHDQPIWDMCAPRYYSPSIKAKIQSQLLN